jgi:hypothetical protein
MTRQQIPKRQAPLPVKTGALPMQAHPQRVEFCGELSPSKETKQKSKLPRIALMNEARLRQRRAVSLSRLKFMDGGE